MNLYLECNNDQEAYEITPALMDMLNELLRLAGELEQVDSGEVALSFVDDETIRQLNKDYRGIDKATDVLSFAMTESTEDELPIYYDDENLEDVELEQLQEMSELGLLDGGKETLEEFEEEPENLLAEPLGDIVISIPKALAQAEEYGHSAEREIGFLFVHGFLHLIGYDHMTEEDEKIMFGKQEEILAKAGITR
ncbi:rRNA maturation RNase YbeY [Paenibacillus mesotrionivorans]|uniref:rRNA maturation RNase YbeY n=1 Tax=Paenibacillus mesotrionivorans TaxID=3160968 RepID=A0ACC7NY50_9BACL